METNREAAAFSFSILSVGFAGLIGAGLQGTALS